MKATIEINLSPFKIPQYVFIFVTFAKKKPNKITSLKTGGFTGSIIDTVHSHRYSIYQAHG